MSSHVLPWYVHMERERARESTASENSLVIRTLILSNQGTTLMTSFSLYYLLKALSPNTVTLGDRERKKAIIKGVESCWEPSKRPIKQNSELSSQRMRKVRYLCTNSHPSLAEDYSWAY